MTDKRRDKVNLSPKIVQATGLEPEKICEVVYLYLAEMHRIMIVDEKGPTAAAMETCFSFGADAAFHLIGLYASNDHYHGRDDDAGVWNEVAMRFIPQAHREGCERISPWFSERTPARASWTMSQETCKGIETHDFNTCHPWLGAQEKRGRAGRPFYGSTESSSQEFCKTFRATEGKEIPNLFGEVEQRTR